MKERAIRFAGLRLTGILTLPDQPSAGAPAVLIPNTGVDHRVGPNRLHVQIGRVLAARGIATLRMDLSGMGDSETAGSGKSSDSVLDQQAALDELTRLGIASRFLVIGLCSGGHDAHLLTVADPRIVGGAYIDHYAYRTRRFVLNYWKQRALNVRRLGNLLQRLTQSSGERAKEALLGEGVNFFSAPSLERFSADVNLFMRRGVSMLFAYTGEVQNSYNYREQLTDAVPALRGYGKLSLHHLPGSDHTFTRAFMREELFRLLVAWIDSQASA